MVAVRCGRREMETDCDCGNSPYMIDGWVSYPLAETEKSYVENQVLLFIRLREQRSRDRCSIMHHHGGTK